MKLSACLVRLGVGRGGEGSMVIYGGEGEGEEGGGEKKKEKKKKGRERKGKKKERRGKKKEGKEKTMRREDLEGGFILPRGGGGSR